MCGGAWFALLAVCVGAEEGICSGQRKSRDALVWLGQKKHSSYDATHANTLNGSMASVLKFYPAVANADVLVWHEGDISHRDANALEGVTNVRWCRLNAVSGWGPRDAAQLTIKRREKRWAAGYLYMIRWYAITCWDVLESLGYEWMMRFDDDSFLLSPVPYDIFSQMRETGHEYGYRVVCRECDRTFSDFVNSYRRSHHTNRIVDDGTIFCERFPRHCVEGKPQVKVPDREPPYCDGPGRLGFYNNWFVTRVGWWTAPAVTALRKAFDDSGLIFSHRNNDLIFQTAAIRLLMARDRWRRFADFSYQHHTVRENAVVWGGIETGYADPHADELLRRYMERWHASDAATKTIQICRVQLTSNDTRLYPISYVAHGKTRGGYLPAPYCNRNGQMPIY